MYIHVYENCCLIVVFYFYGYLGDLLLTRALVLLLCGHTSIVYFNFSIYFTNFWHRQHRQHRHQQQQKHLPPPPPTNCQNPPLWSLLAQPAPSTKNTEKTQSPFHDLPCPTTGTLCQDLDGPTPFEKECLDPRPPRDCLAFVFGCNVDFGHVGNPTIA